MCDVNRKPRKKATAAVTRTKEFKTNWCPLTEREKETTKPKNVKRERENEFYMCVGAQIEWKRGLRTQEKKRVSKPNTVCVHTTLPSASYGTSLLILHLFTSAFFIYIYTHSILSTRHEDRVHAPFALPSHRRRPSIPSLALPPPPPLLLPFTKRRLQTLPKIILRVSNREVRLRSY